MRGPGGGAGSAGVELGGGGEVGTGIVQLALAGQEQAERELRLKGLGIGRYSAPVVALRLVELVFGVGGIACVKESARVGGVGREVRCELGLGGGPVGFDDCCFRGGHGGIEA